MDDIAVLPDQTLTDCGPVCRFFREHGVADFRGLVQAVKDWPYGYPDYCPESIADCLELAYGTCTEKHAIAAAAAAELGLAVYKVVGIYPLEARLVPGMAGLLEQWAIPAIPVTHCFLVYGRYRVDLTEGNCNGKTGPIDRYWKIRQVAPLPAQAEVDEFYRDFLDNELQRFLPAGAALDARQWLELKRQCSECLRLSVACQTR